MTDWLVVLWFLVLPEGYALSPLGYFDILDHLPKRVALALIILTYGVLFGITHFLIQLVRTCRDLWTWILMEP